MEKKESSVEIDRLKKEKILITGHTGFVGSWLYYFLIKKKFKVYGISLAPKKNSLFKLLKLDKHKNSKILDILNQKKLENYFKKIKPNIVIHLAAKSLVLDSFISPDLTYKTNIIGTLNILNIIKKYKSIKTSIIFTTDKVYKNLNKNKKFTEEDHLGGDDPYSGSKSAAEMVINSFSKSFLKDKKIVVMRCGNIIGGGDIAKHRLIPDIVRSIKSKKKLIIRNYKSTRPWQHILDIIYSILKTLIYTYRKKSILRFYNIASSGKSESVEFILNQFKKKFKIQISKKNSNKLEKEKLNLNSIKIYKQLKIRNIISGRQSISNVILFYENLLLKKKDVKELIDKEIENYERNTKNL